MWQRVAELTYNRSGRNWQLHRVWEHEYKPSISFNGYDLTTLADIMGTEMCFSEAMSMCFSRLFVQISMKGSMCDTLTLRRIIRIYAPS
jgi:hypothetical protein